MKEIVVHPFKPIFNKDSKILILGSMPSIKSREEGFYFAHPQNRFWKVLSAIFNQEINNSVQDKTNFLLSHHIALWDVVKSCEISNSQDASIKHYETNDFNQILSHAKIKAIFTLGKTATRLFRASTNLDCIPLPSTSPANCAVSLDKLIDEFKIILKYLN